MKYLENFSNNSTKDFGTLGTDFKEKKAQSEKGSVLKNFMKWRKKMYKSRIDYDTEFKLI